MAVSRRRQRRWSNIVEKDYTSTFVIAPDQMHVAAGTVSSQRDSLGTVLNASPDMGANRDSERLSATSKLLALSR